MGRRGNQLGKLHNSVLLGSDVYVVDFNVQGRSEKGCHHTWNHWKHVPFVWTDSDDGLEWIDGKRKFHCTGKSI